MMSAESNRYIPGTILDMEKMGNVSGLGFIDNVFYITDKIMLTQIREITGIDGTTLQNWLKRGWVGTPDKKSYTREHLARILLINMMRDTMQLSRIIFTLEYINGKADDEKIVLESVLYDYVCRILRELTVSSVDGLSRLDSIIDTVLAGYEEPVTGARKRLCNGIKIVAITYYSSMIKAEAESIIDSLGASKFRKR